MGETRDNEYEDELLDYEEEDAQAPDSVGAKANGESAKKWVFSRTLYFCLLCIPFCLFFSYIFGHLHLNVSKRLWSLENTEIWRFPF